MNYSNLWAYEAFHIQTITTSFIADIFLVCMTMGLEHFCLFSVLGMNSSASGMLSTHSTMTLYSVNPFFYMILRDLEEHNRVGSPLMVTEL